MDEAGNRIEASGAEFSYGEVVGVRVGKDWLRDGPVGRKDGKKVGSTAAQDHTVVSYRRKLHAALQQAR